MMTAGGGGGTDIDLRRDVNLPIYFIIAVSVHKERLLDDLWCQVSVPGVLLYIPRRRTQEEETESGTEQSHMALVCDGPHALIWPISRSSDPELR